MACYSYDDMDVMGGNSGSGALVGVHTNKGYVSDRRV